MVQQGQVSASLAVEAVKTHGKDAAKVLEGVRVARVALLTSSPP